MLKPLAADSLVSKDGLSAQKALAQLYLKWEQPAEASIVLREAHVSRFADDNHNTIDKHNRERAEQRWQQMNRNQHQSVADWRNDIQHGGWRKEPGKSNDLIKSVQAWVDKFDPTPQADTTTAPRVFLVSRHPAAVQWLHQNGYQQAEVVEHIDPTTLQPGDTVVGTLPIHLAAKVCAAGAKMFFLEMNVSHELRGQELSVAQMNQLGARLGQYQVREIKSPEESRSDEA